MFRPTPVPPLALDVRPGTSGDPARASRSGRVRLAGILALCLFVFAGRISASAATTPAMADEVALVPTSAGARLPRIDPDYIDVVVPPNLAPLNFSILEEGCEYRLSLLGVHGQAIEIRQPTPKMRLPPGAWRELLQANRGQSLRWSISVSDPSGEWKTYASYQTPVAMEEIDPYLFYRRLQPLYSTYKHMGIYQRHLETFEETAILRNEKIGHGCVNCHTPQPNAPDSFAISFRGRFGTPTLLVESNRIRRVDLKMGYLAWHPGGKLLTFATNAITQFFHLSGPVNRDTHDAQSGIAVYHLDSGQVEMPGALDQPDRNENWPAWSPDGRTLYYTSGPPVDPREIARLRCDLMGAAYQPENNTWGKPETLVSSAALQLSANQPRPSPNGRHLVFTASDHGSFPLFYPDSDLYLLRLDGGKPERLTINSDHAETYHCWSSNGRWLVFVSRGLDGVFARLMLTHVDAEARFSKPLLLPQEDPGYHDTCLHNFNAPELGLGPVLVSEDAIVEALNAPRSPTQPAPTPSGSVYSRE